MSRMSIVGIGCETGGPAAANRLLRARRAVVGSVLAAVLVVAGCHAAYPPTPSATVASATPGSTAPTASPVASGSPQPCSVPAIDVERSLVVHDPVLLAPSFGFRRTIERILATSGVSGVTAEQLVQSMLDSFNATSFVQPVSGKTVPVKQRPQEAALPAAGLLDPNDTSGMIPVGLFNRLDLAPGDGSNCGEYRIVYAKKQSSPGRFFIIFESKLPNPNPAAGLAGCQPVARFWADLSANGDPASRIAALEKFYYQGLPGFSPVVTHANYGVPFGQVRTNLFVEPLWELREHRTGFDAISGLPVFKVDTVKENPMVEWFRVPGALPPGFTAADQAAFRANYLARPVCNLLRPDRANPSAPTRDVVNGIGGGFDPAGDDFRSVSQGTGDDPAASPDPALTAAIGGRLSQLAATVDADAVLNRTGAMTCGGCHEFSNGAALGNGHTWPNSGGFVHIGEGGQLSNALTGTFLPERARILARFTCDPTAEPMPQAPCPTPAGVTAMMRKAREILPALPSAEGIPAATRDMLVRGRTTSQLRAIDEARAAVVASAQRAPSRDVNAPASRDVDNAVRVLDERVQQAREQEQALPGAFVPVRRTH